MKLLLDQNLSHRLIKLVADVFADCSHVRDFHLESAEDPEIWDFARRNGYMIVSKDDDFHQRSFLFGAPPKVLWVRLGNCSTARIAEALRRNAQVIADFENEQDATFLVIS